MLKLILVAFILAVFSALWAYSMKCAILVKSDKEPEKKDD
jgi:hypothetical protein